MSATADFIGRIDPGSRTLSRVDCGDCDQVISDDAPAFVYFDVAAAAYYLVCEPCHQKPEE